MLVGVKRSLFKEFLKIKGPLPIFGPVPKVGETINLRLPIKDRKNGNANIRNVSGNQPRS